MNGKGDSRRKEAKPGAFAQGYDQINWSKGKPRKKREPNPWHRQFVAPEEPTFLDLTQNLNTPTI